MQLIITDAWLAKSRAIHLTGTKLALSTFFASLILMLFAAVLYHWVFLKGAREGWPVVGALVKLIVKDDFEQRDRFMRENLDALARKLGEMQAKMTQLESLGERVSGLAGIPPAEIRSVSGQGGPLVPVRSLTMLELQSTLADFDLISDKRSDFLSTIESRLFDRKLLSMMVPTQAPVFDASMGSQFGWRIDPFTGTSALHTGLDFSAPQGSAILAAAGGVVVTQEFHPAYGNMIEIDHGNDLLTRYAHASKTFVKRGDLIKRGKKIAEVGTTGRSTGAHLHFEVLVHGVAQDPQKFLAAGRKLALQPLARLDAANQVATLSTKSPAQSRLSGQR